MLCNKILTHIYEQNGIWLPKNQCYSCCSKYHEQALIKRIYYESSEFFFFCDMSLILSGFIWEEFKQRGNPRRAFPSFEMHPRETVPPYTRLGLKCQTPVKVKPLSLAV